MQPPETDRRDFLKTAAGAAFTSSIFTGNLRGANDRVAAAFIGMGMMGTENVTAAMKQPGLEVVAICDVYQTALERAAALVARQGQKAREVKDFREILADKSIDLVCISTPDHWHAYMAVEACKNGKDVYVEKPICVAVEEGQKMVEAARKYKRVVQAGTWQRSGEHFQKACEIVRSGQLGKITFCRTWNYGNSPPEGVGNPPDSDPPPGLDWDLWLGPAPKRPFNQNRWGVYPKKFPYFRYFWDYAGGMMTDWGVHVLDIVQMAFDEAMPKAITALGGRLWLKDNTETPDTLQVTYEYPGFIATYEYRSGNAQSFFNHGYGTVFYGSKGTLFVDRSLYQVFPERGSDLEPSQMKRTADPHLRHWANFLECVKTRQKPASDIENCYRSSAACIMGNVSYRSKLRLDWDDKAQTVLQRDARKYLHREYRKPWKLVV